MVSSAAHPVVLEATELIAELRATRRAALSDCRVLCGEDTAEMVRKRLRGEVPPTPGHQSSPGVDLPTPIRQHLREYENARLRLEALYTEHPKVLDTALASYWEVLRQAALLRLAEQRDRDSREEHEVLFQLAAAGDRELTPAEVQRVNAHRVSSKDPNHHVQAAAAAIPPKVSRDDVLRVVGQLRLREAKRQLASGLLLTEQMREIRAEALPSLRRGEPLLLIGETGGAKTALAEHLSHRLVHGDPEFVSGYGDITSAQVIGAHELRAEQGATFTEFVPGPLIRAMLEGRPIILDELNAMPAEFLKRLNRILQLRPGNYLSVQENAGALVRIREGFVVIATANEQSGRRYRGIEQLSAELVNRFGANTFRVRYPDAGLSLSDTPRENLLLASAAAARPDGRLPRHITVDELERLARAAFISQQVFAGSQGEGFRDYVSTDRAIDGRPGLEESVLAPRTLVALVTKVAGSQGAVSMDLVVQRFVEGIMHREDRAVLSLILRGQGFAVDDV